MSLTVRELIGRPSLRLKVLVEGDLDRRIRWVHSLEMPDPARYLEGDEVILTAGIWYWAGGSADTYVGGLVSAGAAAVGFGTSALVGEVPEDLVAACRRTGITLFHVPDDIAFISIARVFVEAYAAEHSRPLRDSIARSEEFARCLFGDQGLRGTLRILAGLREGWCGVVDSRRGLLAGSASSGGPSTDELRAIMERDTVEGWRVFPIPGRSNPAWLVIEAPPERLTTVERATIDQAIAFIAIELQRQRAVREHTRRFVVELFDLVAAGEGYQQAVDSRLRSFNLDPTQPILVVACDVPDLDAGLLSLDGALGALGQPVVAAAAIKAPFLVAVLQSSSPIDLPQLGARLHAALGSASRIGIGGIVADSRGLRGSLVGAEHACRFARRRDAPGYATHDGLASHSLLLAAQDSQLLDAFERALLLPLQAHDERRKTELVDTLEHFLSSGGQYQVTASALHVHVNTLRLRLAKIESLTGRDLDSMEDRVDFWIALRTRSGRREATTTPPRRTVPEAATANPAPRTAVPPRTVRALPDVQVSSTGAAERRG